MRVRNASRRRAQRQTMLWCYALMIPGAILAGMFTFYPMVMSWYFSFLDWSGITTQKTFVGFANYRELFGDHLFWQSFTRSFVFMLVGTPVQVAVALLVAIVLNNQSRKLSTTFRAFFFMPAVTSVAVVGVVMTTVFSGFNGPVNSVLQALHLTQSPIDFLVNPRTALWTVLGVQVWKGVGLTMIYWLASLQTVPKDYYEAARVDGAGGRQMLTNITIPLLIPFAIVILILTANENLHAFAIVQSMTQGGPYYSTQVIEVFIYQKAFVNGAVAASGVAPRLGYASAAGCLFGVATLFMALLQAWAARKLVNARRQLKRSAA